MIELVLILLSFVISFSAEVDGILCQTDQPHIFVVFWKYAVEMKGYSTVDVLFYSLLFVSVFYENLEAVYSIFEYIMRKSYHVATDFIKNKRMS